MCRVHGLSCGKGLKLETGSDVLPKWKTVIGLTSSQSETFQEFARTVADRKKTLRVHLDLLYWRGAHMAKKSVNLDS